MKKFFILTVFTTLLLVPASQFAQSRKEKEKMAKAAAALPEKKPETTIKEYGKVITKEALSDDGLFIVHKVDKKYYFEISNKLLASCGSTRFKSDNPMGSPTRCLYISRVK